jgi:hypothetical protein
MFNTKADLELGDFGFSFTGQKGLGIFRVNGQLPGSAAQLSLTTGVLTAAILLRRAEFLERSTSCRAHQHSWSRGLDSGSGGDVVNVGSFPS